MDLSKNVVVVLVVAALSVAVTKYYWPRVETKTVEVTKEVLKTDVRTVVKIVEKPDGSKETTTEIVDHSSKESSKSKESVKYTQKDWMVSASASTKFTNIEPIYGAQVQRRILGPIYMGVVASTDKMVGVSVGLEF